MSQYFRTNFQLVCEMNLAYNNPKGDPSNIDWNRVRSQSCNIMDEFIELMDALGLKEAQKEALLAARKQLTPDAFDQTVVFDKERLEQVRDSSCDINVFSYGNHHLMGIDADRDMRSVINGVMTRFIKDEADKAASIAYHAQRGVTDVYFEGEYPTMIMKSGKDQPDAPKGKFVKSASYSKPVFYDPTVEATPEAVPMPDEQAECVVWLRSGVRLFGRIIDGRFCTYDPTEDQYLDYELNWERDITRCLVVPNYQRPNFNPTTPERMR